MVSKKLNLCELQGQAEFTKGYYVEKSYEYGAMNGTPMVDSGRKIQM